jgi:adenylate kinase
VQRAEETTDAITRRLNTYTEKTAPLVDFYKNKGLLVSVKATDSDVVVKAITDKI